MQQQQTYNLTEGNVSKLILRFFFPIFFTNMLQQIYNVADTVIVGKGLGDNALAAVGNMSSLTYFVIGFSNGLAGGFSIVFAQHYGANKYDDLRRSIASAIKLCLVITIVLTTGSIVALKPVLQLMQTSELIIGDSLTYGYVIFGGLIVTIGYNLCGAILRSLGDSKTPFIAIVISTIINIVLNLIFIFVLNKGVFGVAIATIIAQFISMLVCLRKLKKIDIIKLERRDFRRSLSMVLNLLKNGVPMALMNSITSIGIMVIQYFVNGLGVAFTSAYSVCGKYINLFIEPGCSTGIAMSAFTSQNYGARKYKRIREGLHVSLIIVTIAYIVLGATMVLIPRTLAGFMLTGEKPISLVAEFMPICGYTMIFINFLFVYRSGCQAMGHPFVPMLSGVLEMVIRVLVIIFFVSKIGFVATAWSNTVAWLGALILNFVAFEVHLRKKIRTTASISSE